MPNENQDDSQNVPSGPKYVTVEDIGNVVNSAVTAQLKRNLGTAIEAAMKPIMDKLAAAPPPQAPPSGDEESTGKKSKQSPEMAAMHAKIEAMEKALVAEKEATAAAVKKQRDEKAYADLRGSLEGKVRPELIDLIANNIFHVEKRVETDDSGNPLFRTTRPPYAGAEPEDVAMPLRAGVEEYLKSEAAKAYLPAPSAGSGAGPLPKRPAFNPGNGGIDFSKPATSDADRIARARQREATAKQALGQ